MYIPRYMKTSHSSKEEKMLSERELLLKDVLPQDIADNFPLFIIRQELVRYLVRYELFKKVLNVKGSIIECGVHKGSSLMLFAQLSAIHEPYALNRQIIGFDSFKGFPKIHKKDGKFALVGEMDDVDMGLIEKSVRIFDQNRPIGHIPKIKLVKGDATKTIPQFFIDNPATLVALLYLDFDIYEPTKKALEVIMPRMPKGGVIVFDELNEDRWKGETIALLETMKINLYEIKKFPEEPHISYIQL